MKILAPAKINLSLKILNKRKDGYHNIKSVFQTVSLCDEIFISDSQTEKEIEFICEPKVTKKPEDNLAYRAILLLKKYTYENGKIKVKIVKNIPVGAGLGGGSSDAAGVLKGLVKFWNIKISMDVLKKLALKLGADVPFFLYGGKCLVEGIGEKIKRLKPTPEEKNFYILLVYPEFKISTKKVYEMFDKCHCKEFLIAEQQSTNDLEKIVFKKYPELKEIKEKLIDSGTIFSSMSGSGSTIFGIFKKKSDAVKARDQFKKYKTWLVKPVF